MSWCTTQRCGSSGRRCSGCLRSGCARRHGGDLPLQLSYRGEDGLLVGFRRARAARRRRPRRHRRRLREGRRGGERAAHDGAHVEPGTLGSPARLRLAARFPRRARAGRPRGDRLERGRVARGASAARSVAPRRSRSASGPRTRRGGLHRRRSSRRRRRRGCGGAGASLSTVSAAGLSSFVGLSTPLGSNATASVDAGVRRGRAKMRHPDVISETPRCAAR